MLSLHFKDKLRYFKHLVHNWFKFSSNPVLKETFEFIEAE